MSYLHPESLSPDPTYGRPIKRAGTHQSKVVLYPHVLLNAQPQTAAVKAWGKTFDIFTKPGMLKIKPDANRRCELLIDFGTEVDGQLHLDVKTDRFMTVMACFGESEPEASGLVPGHHPNPTHYFRFEKGTHHVASQTRGFRFARLVFCDIGKTLELRGIDVRANLTYQKRDGDFQCSDKRFQRVWQTSLYTARICTQPDTIWDGIKRDRVGWYGDARIIKLAVDTAFFDPRPAEAMLAAMPSDRWANNIPNYSFDGIAMLRQHILTYGVDRPCVRPCYESFLKLLRWAWKTQMDKDGLIKRTDHGYFAESGFVDWSQFPPGGRFEELCWLQCKYLTALRDTVAIAEILQDKKTIRLLTPKIDALAKLIHKRFWNPRKGFIHTLNHVGISPVPTFDGIGWDYALALHHPQFGVGYRKTYEEKIRRGPSGVSRHANALAVLADVTTPQMQTVILKKVFDSPKLPPLITAYFMYYEQAARARCGDPAGAIRQFRDYVGNMLETEDSATLWEVYDPEEDDMRRFSSNKGHLWPWPISLCHGWGAGAVPLATEHLLGIRSVAPAFGEVELNPCKELPWTFTATLPTPHGKITATREKKNGPVAYKLPKGIKIANEDAVKNDKRIVV